MRITVLLIIVLVNSISYAQVDPTVFASYPENAKKLIFVEEFVNPDDTNWNVDKQKVSLKTRNGNFIIKHKMPYPYWAADTTIEIDQSRNFEIEFKVKTPIHNYDLMGLVFWGRDDCDNFHGLNFTNRGRVGMYTCPKRNIYKCNVFFDSEFEHRYDIYAFQIYTIRKVDKHYYIFFNDFFVKAVDFSPFFGNRIGLGSRKRKELVYDYLKIYYLPD